MKKNAMTLCVSFLMSSMLFAQQEVAQCGVPTEQASFSMQAYKELPNPIASSSEEWAKTTLPCLSWGTTDKRYAKQSIPDVKSRKMMNVEGWRGEKLNVQAVVWTGTAIESLNYSLTDFKDTRGNTLPSEAFSGGFVRYVMTDELNKDGKGACGYRPDHSIYDSLLVADPIDHLSASLSQLAMSTQPIWISCRVPQNTVPGVYKGQLEVKDGDKILGVLNLNIKVSSRTLPIPSEWAYHLDLWQNPFAVARYYQVPLWSREHFDAMRPLMKMLADAGQKIITATIMHKPWNGQTYDYYETMVTWMKKVDGTWLFDFTVFDKWVEFMKSVGIDQQINCYSMIPWKLSFQYFDQATNRLQTIQTAPGETAYEELWVSMLKAFSKHLREKGWFDICTIAVDERPMEVMLNTLAVIRKAEPEFKISLAGNYHKELEESIYDYCISIGSSYPADVVQRRAKANLRTTYYTCCTEAFPNTFTFSAPAEAAWMSYYSAKDHLDGYLRWAYNSWPKEPLLDSRFEAWAGGDTYMIYPGARSSIRFEKLIEGIQAHEKIRLLRQEFTEKDDKAGLKKIENLLSSFQLKDFPQVPAETTVNKAKKVFSSL